MRCSRMGPWPRTPGRVRESLGAPGAARPRARETAGCPPCRPRSEQSDAAAPRSAPARAIRRWPGSARPDRRPAATGSCARSGAGFPRAVCTAPGRARRRPRTPWRWRRQSVAGRALRSARGRACPAIPFPSGRRYADRPAGCAAPAGCRHHPPRPVRSAAHRPARRRWRADRSRTGGAPGGCRANPANRPRSRPAGPRPGRRRLCHGSRSLPPSCADVCASVPKHG